MIFNFSFILFKFCMACIIILNCRWCYSNKCQNNIYNPNVKPEDPLLKLVKDFFSFWLFALYILTKKMILLKNASKLDPHEEYLDIRLRRLFHFPCIWINNYIIWRFRSVRSHTKFWLIVCSVCNRVHTPYRRDI